MIQNKINNGESDFALFLIMVSLLLVTTINDVANENRKATFKKRPPDGSKLKILATARNNNENPSKFRVFEVRFPLKNKIEMKITVK